ncbi:hypothetical protein IMY05_C4590000200 [Salix suchowensis]|nr:hypothetical protein IMY05_C4590000200 [Salix suchowensis]
MGTQKVASERSGGQWHRSDLLRYFEAGVYSGISSRRSLPSSRHLTVGITDDHLHLLLEQYDQLCLWTEQHISDYSAAHHLTNLVALVCRLNGGLGHLQNHGSACVGIRPCYHVVIEPQRFRCKYSTSLSIAMNRWPKPQRPWNCRSGRTLRGTMALRQSRLEEVQAGLAKLRRDNEKSACTNYRDILLLNSTFRRSAERDRLRFLRETLAMRRRTYPQPNYYHTKAWVCQQPSAHRRLLESIKN